jgi:hypothetical protein
MRVALAVALAGLLALAAGCGGPALTAPPAMTASLESWARIGLACAGPSVSGQVQGLLDWSCSGVLHGVEVSAAIHGDARGVFLASVSVPALVDQATIVAVFADVADATVAYAAVGPQIHSWLAAWGGGVDGATFGPASLAIAPSETLGSPASVSFYMTGPRTNIGDPIP